jgi:hypothetical protein
MTYEEKVRDIAKHMLSVYRTSKYTPEERASDHAFSYDSHEDGRKFWLAVIDAMYQLNQGA